MYDCVSVKLYLQKQETGHIWPMGHIFPTPELKCIMDLEITPNGMKQ